MLPKYFNSESWETVVKHGLPLFAVKNKSLLWRNTVLQVGEDFPGLEHEAKKMYNLHRIGVAIKEEPKEGKRKWAKKNSKDQ